MVRSKECTWLRPYWSQDRTARNTKGLVVRHPRDWYLNQAYETSLAKRFAGPYYARFSLMEGTIFIRLLEHLKAEG